ncbi:MAG: serine hydrolase domain-containing protein, partial [Gemmatimonadaceae bacterium]
MRAILPLIIAMSTFAAGGATVVVAQPQPLDTMAVDAFVREQLKATRLPGAAIAITRGTDVLFVRGYGTTSTGEAIGPDTPFRVASLSKSFTALAVMQLVDEGKVQLDTPVRAYLPEFELADPRGARITVRQLLDQTSGMSDRGFPEVSRPQPRSLRGAVQRLRTARLTTDPGTAWSYHNPNYQVAARLVEVVSGEPFAAYLRRHVFEPLGMSHTTTTDTDDQAVPGLADGYTFPYGIAVARPAPGYFVAGSGGVVTTAADMARWLIAQSNGGVGANGARVVSATSVTAMHTPSELGEYALGWDIDGPRLSPTRIEHGGTQFTFSAHQALLPASGFGVAVLFNSATTLWAEQVAIIDGVIALVEGRAPEPGAPVSFIADLVLAILTLATLALGALGIARSRGWASRRATRPAWRIALALLPHLALPLLFAALPAVAGFVFGGRDVTWRSLVFAWPALAVWLAVAA